MHFYVLCFMLCAVICSVVRISYFLFVNFYPFGCLYVNQAAHYYYTHLMALCLGLPG